LRDSESIGNVKLDEDSLLSGAAQLVEDLLSVSRWEIDNDTVGTQLGEFSQDAAPYAPGPACDHGHPSSQIKAVLEHITSLLGLRNN
jgi:hypothetical protein